jgi:hypothetical protein
MFDTLNIIKIAKGRKVRQAGYKACIKYLNVDGDNIKTVEGVDWIQMAQYSLANLVNITVNLRIYKRQEVSYNHQLLK